MSEQKSKKTNPPAWSESDIEALRKHYPKGGSKAVMPHLSVPRSMEAIKRNARRCGIQTDCYQPSQMNFDASDPDIHTADDLACLFGVSRNVVECWIKKGWLTSDGRIIRRTAVKKFIRDYPGHVPLKTADPYWFIDLLAGPPRRAAADSSGVGKYRAEGEETYGPMP